jgi:predicted pyridoxine 5'-phosphate oxidase superfamily flavin-nucleotide-binding protein
MKFDQPFHEGEIRAQKLAGEAWAAEQNGQIIADEIPGGALAFIENQPFSVIGSSDPEGRLWASVLLGELGFMRAHDRRTVTVDLKRAFVSPSDPLWRNLETDPKVGALVIDLATRRRLRINGNLSKTGDDSLELFVAESFPNCPKFIQRRHFVFDADFSAERSSDNATGVGVKEDKRLNDEQRQAIERADTFFVTSAHAGRGLDASHRGGNAGFVKMLDEKTLRIPDYPGNGMFQTFGNLLTNPKAGLVFPDFEGKRLLQLSGTVAIEWNAVGSELETGGTGRFWDFHIERVLETPLPDGLRWEFLDASPYNP